jgi:hypothetical protein
MQPRPRRTLVLNERRPIRDSLRVTSVVAGSLLVAAAVAAAVPSDANPVVPISLFMLTIVGAVVLGGPIAAFAAAVIVAITMALAFIEPVEGDAPSAVLAGGLFVVTALGLSLGLGRLDVAKRRANAEKLELDLLAEATTALSTLDLDLAIRRLAVVLVPGLADGCVVDLITEEGRFRCAVAADRRASATPLIDALERIPPDPASTADPAVAAVATGEPVLIRRVDDKFLRTIARDDEHLRITRSLGPRSLLAVPIADDDGVVGALTLAQHRQSARRFSASDIVLAGEIARRLAGAIGRARAYESERQSVQVLQRTLLPGRLPSIEGVRLSRLYRPAAAEVGGDWYAVVPLSANQVGLAVGDVAGHGIAAATVMANVRFALQAFAFDGTKPETVLERLNQLLLHYRGETLVTACYGVLDLAAMTWRHACAGHVPPVLRSRAGTTLLASAPGLPLSVDAHAPFADEVFSIEPGDAILLYSDGLIERRGESLEDGLARLQGAVARHGPLDLDRLADGLLDPSHGDDVVALAAEITPTGNETVTSQQA